MDFFDLLVFGVVRRTWGLISLIIAYIWQLYTMWILIRLHEATPGIRYSRYVQLAQAAFGSISHLLEVKDNVVSSFRCTLAHAFFFFKV